MRPLAAVALDASLGFQSLDELLHGRHLRVGDFLMEDGGDFAAGGLAAVPEDLQDGEFAVGNSVKFHGPLASVQ